MSITDLSRYPQRFDGRLVRVRGRLEFGWEGDNYLFEPSAIRGPDTSSHFPHVWFYCKSAQEGRVYCPVSRDSDSRLGTFMGYFHFVPDQKSRINDVFDPGPLQLEIIGVSTEDHLSP